MQPNHSWEADSRLPSEVIPRLLWKPKIQSVVQHTGVLSCKLCIDNPYHFLHNFQLFELHVSTNIGHLQALLRVSWAIALYLYRCADVVKDKS
jgi:hypothetical protein